MPWILRKPFRYACHQWLGKQKGEAFYLFHVERLGEKYREVTPDEFEAFLAAIPEIKLGTKPK